MVKRLNEIGESPTPLRCRFGSANNYDNTNILGGCLSVSCLHVTQLVIS